MEKHAYLIMAHNEFNLLNKLIKLLDHPRNDIYIHVDRKSKSFDQTQLTNLEHSTITFIQREKVSWGAYSQINCIIRLLREAAKTPHDYYHLLSGVDLPLKAQDEIHSFFDRQSGSEFISYQAGAMTRQSFISRIRYYHFIQEFIGHKKKPNILYQFNRVLLKIQEILNVNRIKYSKFDYKKGDTWFSITQKLGNYVLLNQSVIKRSYRFTQCADEIFLHTLVWNSDFRKNIINNSLRLIDWKRGRPHTFQFDDFNELIQSDAFWARKFSEQVDPVIVDKIYAHIRDKQI